MKKRALIVVTSHSELGDTGKQTGYYLPEVSHPFYQLIKAGVEVEIASIDGGTPPMDEKSRDLTDPVNRVFLEEYSHLLENTSKLSAVDPSQYGAILFAGGHGTMWDFPQGEGVNSVSVAIYENGGIVSAVCHGPAALVNLKLSDGSFLIDGKKLTGFSNVEEDKAGLTEVMPFLLETALREKGAIYESSPAFQEKLVVDGRLITGQNPASAAAVGRAIATQLNQ